MSNKSTPYFGSSSKIMGSKNIAESQNRKVLMKKQKNFETP
jgi:hypothetical protein